MVDEVGIFRWEKQTYVVRNLEGMVPFTKRRCRWKDNIKMDLSEIGCELDLAG
jgi:hypothetical protein